MKQLLGARAPASPVERPNFGALYCLLALFASCSSSPPSFTAPAGTATTATPEAGSVPEGTLDARVPSDANASDAAPSGGPRDGASPLPSPSVPTEDASDLDAATDASPSVTPSNTPSSAPLQDAQLETDTGACNAKVTHVPNEGATHVEVGSEIEYVANPPASGPHYPNWAQFGAYQSEVPRAYWVHNLEHGAVVFLIGALADADTRATLQDVFSQVTDPSCASSPRKVLTPDSHMETPFAVVTWDYVFTADCVTPSEVLSFVQEHIGQGTESVCSSGSYVPE